jgi:hypothetical protein
MEMVEGWDGEWERERFKRKDHMRRKEEVEEATGLRPSEPGEVSSTADRWRAFPGTGEPDRTKAHSDEDRGNVPVVNGRGCRS